MRACFSSADILLPSNKVASDAWAVVACDQFTSQLSYWKDVENIVGNRPSSLNIIFPEVFLGDDKSRIHSANSYMKQYLQDNILTERVSNGFVLVERGTEAGIRVGLVGKIDLECYEYKSGTDVLIRATEGTVESRIPPRVQIRESAILETPHVMLLMDDKKRQLIEPLYDRRKDFEQLYDVELMKSGGRVSGYAIEGRLAEQVNNLISDMQIKSKGFFLAVGDGNHSLATAKTCWDNLKRGLTEKEKKLHPARYALVEVVNLHSSAIKFEPIHRILFNVDYKDLMEKLHGYILSHNMSIESGKEFAIVYEGIAKYMALSGLGNRLPIEVLQQFLDDYLQLNPLVEIDYIHGEDALLKLTEVKENCGIILNPINKDSLFPAIAAGGILPRKTFSMGEAHEKRYYMECRKISY